MSKLGTFLALAVGLFIAFVVMPYIAVWVFNLIIPLFGFNEVPFNFWSWLVAVIVYSTLSAIIHSKD